MKTIKGGSPLLGTSYNPGAARIVANQYLNNKNVRNFEMKSEPKPGEKEDDPDTTRQDPDWDKPEREHENDKSRHDDDNDRTDPDTDSDKTK
jgi:hypothetical protein